MGTSEGHQGSAHLAEDDNVPLDIIPSGVQVVHQRIHPTQPSVLCRREGIVSICDDDAIKSHSSRIQVAISTCAGERVSCPSVMTMRRSLPPAGR